jgi:hypothetical protein
MEGLDKLISAFKASEASIRSANDDAIGFRGALRDVIDREIAAMTRDQKTRCEWWINS